MFWFIVFGLASAIAGTGVLALTVGIFIEALDSKDVLKTLAGFLFSSMTFVIYAFAYWLAFIAPHMEW